MSAMLALAARRAARGRPRGPGRLAGAARSRGGGGEGGEGAGGPALHFCVVGSGPAGFYTAERLAKAFGGRARIDVLDRLPTPFGLVRYGVAPDHAATKSVINQFTASALEAANRIRFFGNVEVGRDVRVEELDRMYSALVLACGCPGDKRLGLRGEGLEGVLSAREFVSWYNGVPDWEKAPPDLGDVTDVTVIGQGNVALDCARLLLKGPERLGGTDITQGALAALRGSAVRRVHLVGRRGPAQASFTGKELREILGLEGCAVHVKAEDLELSDLDRAELKRSRIRKRVARIFADRARAGNPPGAAKGLHLHFFRQPVRFLEGGGRVKGVEVEKTTLEGGGEGVARSACGTGEVEAIPAQLVLKSVGYEGTPLPGVPFDERTCTVPHALGRVDRPGRARTYAVGWQKRGPSGIIATNLHDAEETVASIVEDAAALRRLEGPGAGGAALTALLAGRGVQVVTFADWLRLDREEERRGAACGKPREKILDVATMLAIAADRQTPEGGGAGNTS